MFFIFLFQVSQTVTEGVLKDYYNALKEHYWIASVLEKDTWKILPLEVASNLTLRGSEFPLETPVSSHRSPKLVIEVLGSNA